MSRISTMIPGHNVDRLDVLAGIRELVTLGYHSDETQTIIFCALVRWARGEEAKAEKGAIDLSFHGIPLTCWRRVLAAATSGATSQTGSTQR